MMKLTQRAYAFRTFVGTVGGFEGSSSAEWHEDTALELGDRVAEHSFMEFMWHMYPGGCWPGSDPGAM